jgi:two-component system response regulator FixJ
MKPHLRTLYVVDDDELVRHSLEWLFSTRGWRVRTFEKPQECLEALNEERAPTVIVTDFHMPGMNGVEFMEAMPRYLRNLPVIIVTGDDLESAASRKAAQAGARQVLCKPVYGDVIEEAVEAAVSHVH